MSCRNCERLRRKLSPLEDKEFTKEYKAKEPRAWLDKQRTVRWKNEWIMFKPADLYRATFRKVPTLDEVTRLGRTLDALGWERTRAAGELYFRIRAEEFEDYT